MESNSSFITFLVYDEVACVSSQISPMGNLRLSPQMNLCDAWDQIIFEGLLFVC